MKAQAFAKRVISLHQRSTLEKLEEIKLSNNEIAKQFNEKQEKLEKEVAEIKVTSDGTLKQLSEMELSIAENKDEIETLKAENAQLRSKCENSEKFQHLYQQDQLADLIAVHAIPYSQGEDTRKLVFKLFQILGCENDITIKNCYRKRSKNSRANQIKPIVFKCDDADQRKILFKKKAEKGNIYLEQIVSLHP